VNARAISATSSSGSRVEVANAAPVDAGETGPEPEPKQRARDARGARALHHGDERGEEAILLVAVAAPGHEVGDDLFRVVEPGEHRVLGFGCLERLL
jgi:hypothetical protein